MNAAIRKLALTLAVIFAVLFVNLNYIQLGRSRDLSNDPRNRRLAMAEEGVRRGEIIAADGTVLAESVPTGDEDFPWRRTYPEGRLYGHITGYYSSPFFCDSAGLERTQAAFLSGREPAQVSDFVDELLGREREGNILRLTIDPDLQKVARKAFGSQRGGAAVINASTGAVLALYGNPGFDPNTVTDAPLRECGEVIQRLDRQKSKPLLSRAFQVRYPPGSTFKIVTAAAGLRNGMTLNTSFRSQRRLDLPDTDKTLGNFGNSTCGGSLLRAFMVSCNTAFAQIGLRVGEEKLVKMATDFGLNRSPEFDLTALPSCVQAPFTGRACDEPDLSRPFVAYTSIGQGNVRVTPLQMALVAGTVANGGYVPKPFIVNQVLDRGGKVLQQTEPERSKRIYPSKTAQAMRKAMIEVVRGGTGRVVGFKDARKGIIGGKTGTAQTGREGEAPHVWFVAFGPKIAVAVVVENGGSLRSEATGGKVAGPIAKALLEAAMAKREGKDD